MEFFKRQTHFPFMATRKWWYGISGILIAASFALLFTRGLNLTVDFTGGVVVEAAFPEAPNLDEVRRALEEGGFNEVQAQNFGSARDVLIRLPPIVQEGDASRATEELRTRMEGVLRGIDERVEVSRLEMVGPQVGAELRESAWWAFGFTILMIFLYLLFRFHTWRLSLSAIISTVHDPALLIGIWCLTQWPFDLTVVAAILAVVGYSLNDTVVVFDRVRERFQLNRRGTPQQVIDESINETLSRTLMTSVTVLIVLIVLYFFGGPVLQPFSLALIIGVLVGTYSSIYIAGALSLDFGLKAEHLFPQEKKHPIDHLP